jgi:hypothetical protein
VHAREEPEELAAVEIVPELELVTRAQEQRLDGAELERRKRGDARPTREVAAQPPAVVDPEREQCLVRRERGQRLAVALCERVRGSARRDQRRAQRSALGRLGELEREARLALRRGAQAQLGERQRSSRGNGGARLATGADG